MQRGGSEGAARGQRGGGQRGGSERGQRERGQRGAWRVVDALVQEGLARAAEAHEAGIS